MIDGYPAAPIELTCSVSDATLTVTADEATGEITQNDSRAINPRISRNMISYTVTSRSGKRVAVTINRIDGSVAITVYTTDARRRAAPVRLTGMCRRITQRAF